MTRALPLILLLLCGCTKTAVPEYDVVLDVTPIADVRLPLRTPGAVAAWTSRGFLLIPEAQPGAQNGDDRGAGARLRRAQPTLETPARGAFLYSPASGALVRLPGGAPGGLFEAAAELDGGAVILTLTGGWFVDVNSGEWTPLRDTPGEPFYLEAHAVRPGALLLYGQQGGTCVAWELSDRGRRRVRLPQPPCSAYVRLAADADRWWVFADREGQLRAASLQRGDDRWRDPPRRGAPSVFGAAVAAQGTVALTGMQTFPFLWVTAAGRRGVFVLDHGAWTTFDPAAEAECGWRLRELRGDVLFAMGDGRPACAWDLRRQRRLRSFTAPSFDTYVRGDGLWLGWGHTTRRSPRRVDPEPSPIYSHAAALIRWRATATSPR